MAAASGPHFLHSMKARRLLFLLPFFIATAASADWHNVAPGVDYQEFRADTYDIYVTRVSVASDQVRIVVSNETDKGLKVSDYAKEVSAIAAVNGDYFDDRFNPVGYAVGSCGSWTAVKDMQREIVLQVANQHAVLRPLAEIDPSATPTVDAAISGWPVIVADCKPLGPKELPGRDAFTRAPHPRTAVGISNDGTLVYFVAADGRRAGIPGLTLAALAAFMADKLGVCSAMNLDGGGSTAMWVGDRIVNHPSDGVERGVGDHIAVVFSRDYPGCPPPPQKTSSAEQR